MNKGLQRVVKLGLGVIVGLVLSEVVIRVLPRSLLPAEFKILDRVYDARGAWQDMMQPDPVLGYALKPNLDIQFPSEGRAIPIRTTTHGVGTVGFRDIGTAPPFAAVAIGDSFTLCDDVSVEHCWVKHVADRTGMSFATLGVNGYSTLAEARVLDRYGRKLKPRLVLLGIFPNDFKDNVNFDEWTRSGTDDFWVWLGGKRGRGEFGRWLADRSIIYRMVDGAMRVRTRDIDNYKQGDLDFVFRLDKWWLDLVQDTENNPGWHLMQKAILDIQRTSKEMGAQLVVLLFPPKEQIYWDIARQFAPPEAQNLTVSHPLDIVQTFLDSHHIASCRFEDALRAEASRGRQVYHRISSHWNDAGNAIGAQTVLQCLATKGLIEPPPEPGARAAAVP